MRIRFGSFELDDERFALSRAGVSVALRPKVFDLLVVLVRERHRVVRRDELFERLWSTTAVGPGSLSGLVNELRTALGENGRGPSSIRTVHARGYQFVAPVEEATSDAPAGFAGPSPVAERDEEDAPPPNGSDRTRSNGSFEAVRGAVTRGEAVHRLRAGRLREILDEVLRSGARALVASIPDRLERSAWLARTVAEALVAGFSPRRMAVAGSAVRPVGSEEGSHCDSRAVEAADVGAARARGERMPVALCLEVDDPIEWEGSGGLRRLLDLSGSAPVLVIAAFAARPERSPARALEVRDARIECVDAPTGEVGERSGAMRISSHADPAAELLRVLQALERADRSAFAASLRAMGFESARVDPIRAMRRVEPSPSGAISHLDAEAG